MTDASPRSRSNPQRAARRRSSARSWRCSPRSGSRTSASPRSRAAPASRSRSCASSMRPRSRCSPRTCARSTAPCSTASIADMAEEPPRERLFDVLMRRLDVARARTRRRCARCSVRCCCNPGLALALNGLAVRSMQWMLTAADISATGPKGMVRAQGLALLYRLGAAHLGRRRRSRPGAHARRARPRAGERPALGRLARRSAADSGSGLQRHPRVRRAAARRGSQRRERGGLALLPLVPAQAVTQFA